MSGELYPKLFAAVAVAGFLAAGCSAAPASIDTGGRAVGEQGLSWLEAELPAGIDEMGQVKLSSVGELFYLTDVMPGGTSLTSVDGLSWEAADDRPGESVGWESSGDEDWSELKQNQVSEGPFDRGVFSLVGVEDGSLAADLGGWLWFTGNGSNWERLASTPNQQGVLFELIPWQGHALARSEDGRTLVAARSAGFSSLELAETAPAPSGFSGAIGAGQAGIAYIAEFQNERGPNEVVYSPDGVNWEVSPLPDPTSSAYCCYFDLFGIAVGDEAVLMLTAAQGGSGPLTLWRGTPPQA